jgi:hypothetical protein
MSKGMSVISEVRIDQVVISNHVILGYVNLIQVMSI